MKTAAAYPGEAATAPCMPRNAGRSDGDTGMPVVEGKQVPATVGSLSAPREPVPERAVVARGCQRCIGLVVVRSGAAA